MSVEESYVESYCNVMKRHAHFSSVEVRRLLAIEEQDHQAAVVGTREWHATAGRAAAYTVLLARKARA